MVKFDSTSFFVKIQVKIMDIIISLPTIQTGLIEVYALCFQIFSLSSSRNCGEPTKSATVVLGRASWERAWRIRQATQGEGWIITQHHRKRWEHIRFIQLKSPSQIAAFTTSVEVHLLPSGKDPYN